MDTDFSPEFSPSSSQPSAVNEPSAASSLPRRCLARHSPAHRSLGVGGPLATCHCLIIGTQKSSQKMLSHSKFTTCNFLIGTNFNTSCSSCSHVASISLPPSQKLEFPLTLHKSTTSEFLIDNFGACITRRPPWWRTTEAEGFRPPHRTAVPLPCASFASFASSTSCISNRHNLELEIGVSRRKQRIGPFSNRHKFAFCNFPLAAPKLPVHPDAGRSAKRACPPKHTVAKAGRSRLSTIICHLRYNGGVKIECNTKGDKK